MINRRGFVGALVALLGLPKLLRASPERGWRLTFVGPEDPAYGGFVGHVIRVRAGARVFSGDFVVLTKAPLGQTFEVRPFRPGDSSMQVWGVAMHTSQQGHLVDVKLLDKQTCLGPGYGFNPGMTQVWR